MAYKEQYRRCNQYQLQATAEWLDTFNWSAFATFTTYYALSLKNARLKMIKLKKCLEAKYGPDGSDIFWVAERNVDRKSYHLHALIRIKESPDVVISSITKAWHTVAKPGGYKQHNLMRVLVYEHSKGAHYYISKDLQKDHIDFDWF